MRKIPGTHRFLGLIACNRCGRKWAQETSASDIREHTAACQPGLAVTP
jgi:hypothetical protein